MKKIKTFMYNLREIDIEDIDRVVNEWLKLEELNVIDINTMMFNRNGGYDCFICYSITYETDNLKDRFEEAVRENENLKYQIKNMINNQEDRPIESLELSVRSFNCLKRAGINTNKDLLKRYYDGTLKQDKIRNLGSKCEKEIIEKIESELLGYER